MKDGLRFVDCDMHIMEPVDLFDRYLDPRFKDRVTSVVGSVVGRNLASAKRTPGEAPRSHATLFNTGTTPASPHPSRPALYRF